MLDAAGEHVLLTLHRKAGAWFQFGGHYEPADVDPHAAATREAREESGIGDLVVAPGARRARPARAGGVLRPLP